MGARGATKHGRMELHTATSAAARAILGGHGRGDVLDGNGKRGVKDVNNTSKEGSVGKTTGTNRTAGNINTRG